MWDWISNHLFWGSYVVAVIAFYAFIGGFNTLGGLLQTALSRLDAIEERTSVLTEGTRATLHITGRSEGVETAYTSYSFDPVHSTAIMPCVGDVIAFESKGNKYSGKVQRRTFRYEQNHKLRVTEMHVMIEAVLLWDPWAKVSTIPVTTD